MHRFSSTSVQVCNGNKAGEVFSGEGFLFKATDALYEAVFQVRVIRISLIPDVYDAQKDPGSCLYVFADQGGLVQTVGFPDFSSNAVPIHRPLEFPAGNGYQHPDRDRNSIARKCIQKLQRRHGDRISGLEKTVDLSMA